MRSFKIFFLMCLLAANTAFAQKSKVQNPYEEFGVHPEVLTLSKGRYYEFFDNDTLTQIGSIVFNTVTGKIEGFIETDTLYSEATLKPEVISRWLSPDPLADEFPSWSPYNFVNCNPIIFIDKKGLAPDYYEGADGNIVHRNSTASTLTENGQTLKNIGTEYASFNGSSLDLHYQTADKNGNLIPGTFSTPAVSGRPNANGMFDYSNTRQGIKGVGPIPEGKYSINPQAVRNMTLGDDLIGQGFSFTQLLGMKVGAFPGGNPAWRLARLGIEGGATSRSGFTIHGGTSPGSAGCIDCMRGETMFFDNLQKYSGGSTDVMLKVDYSGLKGPISNPFGK